MVRESNMKHCPKCQCTFINYKVPDQCPICDKEYMKIKKVAIKKRKACEQQQKRIIL